MRPASINMFEKLFFISIALGALSLFLNFEGQVAEIQSDPNLAALGAGGGFLIGILVFGLLINLLLWYFIARKASNVAKWIWVALTLLGMLGIPALFAGEFGLMKIFSLIGFLLSIAMIYYLFQPDAKAWFNKEGPSDPSVFE